MGIVWIGVMAGCSGDGNSVRVAGVVTLDGNPLPRGFVVFHPDNKRGNASKHLPRGEIDADGNYVLFSARRRGAAPGWYKVAVIAIKSPPRQGKLTPARYAQPGTSGLDVEVVADAAAGSYDLKLAK